MLKDYIAKHQREIQEESERRFLETSVSKPSASELAGGIPILIQQIIDSLPSGNGNRNNSAVTKVAAEYGVRLFQLGFTLSEVVAAYSAVCETTMKLADKAGISIKPRDYETFNSIIDVAIAGAVTSYDQQQNEAASHRQSEHLGTLAHELRNSLSNALLARDLIRSGHVRPGGRTGDVLDHCLRRMQNLIDRELGDVRLREGSEPIGQHVRLAELLDQVTATGRHDAKARGIEFLVEVDHGVEFDTDPQLILSIVGNLIHNAFKYSRAGGRVALSGYLQNGRVVIDVEDTCGGLPPEKVSNLFQPFVRGTRQEPGIGLGLWIVKRAVESLHGQIAVRDLPGQGCIFSVQLPPHLSDQRAA